MAMCGVLGNFDHACDFELMQLRPLFPWTWNCGVPLLRISTSVWSDATSSYDTTSKALIMADCISTMQ
jgi:hypothetical protein